MGGYILPKMLIAFFLVVAEMSMHKLVSPKWTKRNVIVQTTTHNFACTNS